MKIKRNALLLVIAGILTFAGAWVRAGARAGAGAVSMSGDANIQIDQETLKVMPFVTDKSYCMDCHSSEELAAKTGAQSQNTILDRACDPACFKCHKDREAHHKTGMEITFDVPPTLRLPPGKRLSCTTCHNLTIKRFGTRPRKAQSLFGRLFKGKKQYKSYYLVMDNRKGQLCKHCH